LRIGESRLRLVLLFGLLGSLIWSLWLIWHAGFALAANGLGLVMLPLWISMVVDSSAGVILHWRTGTWMLDMGPDPIEIELRPRGAGLPWVIYIPWRERGGGRRGCLWLFSDAIEEEDLRRLRARLALV